MSLLSLYQQKTIKNCQNFLGKGLKDQCVGMNIKQKVRKQYTTNEYGYFLESQFVGINRLFVLVYSNQENNAKRYKSQRYYLPKGVTKKYNVIIKGRSFYDQPIHSGIKRYKELKKLTTDQDENYTTGCLLDYDFIKNNYRLIAGDLKR